MATQALKKIRVFELAKSLGLETKAVLDYCRDLGYDVKNQLSSLETDQVDALKQRIAKGGRPSAAAPATPRPRRCRRSKRRSRPCQRPRRSKRNWSRNRLSPRKFQKTKWCPFSSRSRLLRSAQPWWKCRLECRFCAPRRRRLLPRKRPRSFRRRRSLRRRWSPTAFSKHPLPSLNRFLRRLHRSRCLQLPRRAFSPSEVDRPRLDQVVLQP